MIPCASDFDGFNSRLADSDKRLDRRYHELVISHLAHAHSVAAGTRPPASLAQSFAAVQGAWRFYANARVNLEKLAGPLLQCARQDVPEACDEHFLVVLDWCNLHFNDQAGKADCVSLSCRKDKGYELLTALAVSDRTGAPIAPLCLEMRAADGVHSTRVSKPFEPLSSLDSLQPVMRHVREQNLGATPIFMIDREADSVGHYRSWDADGLLYIVRSDKNRLVLHDCKQKCLGDLVEELKRQNMFVSAGTVDVKGVQAEQHIAQTMVVLHRPARSHRVDKKTGKARHRDIPGTALPLRLIVSEIRDPAGKVLACWLLLSNLPASVAASRIALWYYWRWRIESYHKLLKSAGQELENWQQESARAMSRRLLVAAMAGVLVWRLARENSEAAQEMRQVLVRLSGRQMKRGKNARDFTEPALLAGLGVLIPMLDLLGKYTLDELRSLSEAALPYLISRSTYPKRPAVSRPPDPAMIV